MCHIEQNRSDLEWNWLDLSNLQNLEQKSHFSFAELGFPSEFRENYFPKRHFFGSPFDNKLVNVMTDEYVKEIPADYRLR